MIKRMSGGLHLDSTLSSMEEQRFKSKYKTLIQKLSQEVHFTYNEIESLCIIYYKLQKQAPEPTKGVAFKQMQNFLHDALDMTDQRFSYYVLIVLDVARTEPNVFSMESFVKAMSLLLRGTLEEKIRHCYKVYDPFNTGKITRTTMVDLLSHTIIEEGGTDPEDSVRELVEIMSVKLDTKRDGKISFESYREMILENPLFLEALGPCLPSRMAIRSFLTTFTPWVGNIH